MLVVVVLVIDTTRAGYGPGTLKMAEKKANRKWDFRHLGVVLLVGGVALVIGTGHGGAADKMAENEANRK